MLARKSRVIQPGLTGTVGSARAAGSTVSVASAPAAMASSKALSFPAVGGHARRVRIAGHDQVVLGEPLGKFAALGVAHPDPVPDPQAVRGRTEHRGLHLTGALGLGQPQPAWPEWRRQPV